GIHRASRNRVVRKLLTGIPDGGRRIVDVLTEYAGTFGERGHRRRHRSSDALTLTLIVGEEEGPVLGDGPAEHAPVLIAPVLRFGRKIPLKGVPCVQVLVAKELEYVAVKGVATRFGREVDYAAIEPAELGGWAVAFDLELLDRVDHRVV